MTIKQWWPSIKLFLTLSVLVGGLYSALVTGLAKLFFPFQAGGSLISVHQRVVGSKWVGQMFTSPEYFQARPSMTAYQNDKPESAALLLAGTSSIKAFKQSQYQKWHTQRLLPDDLLYPSASMVDPHISMASIWLQLSSVAKARNISPRWLSYFIKLYREKPSLGVLGEERVNVLLLNLALDKELNEQTSS